MVDPGFGRDPAGGRDPWPSARPLHRGGGTTLRSPARGTPCRDAGGLGRRCRQQPPSESAEHQHPRRERRGIHAAPGQPGFTVDVARVDSGFFEATGIPILQGRNFGPEDLADGPPVAIVNEAMAQRFWPARDPVGQVFRADGREVTVVGVARTAKIRTLEEAPRPFVYRPFSQDYSPLLWLVASTRGDASRALLGVLGQLRSLDPDLMILQARTMERHLATMLLPARLGALTFTVFSALALMLATIGVYGIVAYALRSRTREIGIRLSLGARPSAAVLLLMGSGLRLVLGRRPDRPRSLGGHGEAPRQLPVRGLDLRPGDVRRRARWSWSRWERWQPTCRRGARPGWIPWWRSRRSSPAPAAWRLIPRVARAPSTMSPLERTAMTGTDAERFRDPMGLYRLGYAGPLLEPMPSGGKEGRGHRNMNRSSKRLPSPSSTTASPTSS